MPVYSIDKQKDGSIIAIWEIIESEKELLENCSLPNSEQEEMSFISNEQRRKERLAVRLLLDHVLNKKIYLGYHENDHPFLQNEVGHISISHTKRFACIIYHPTEHVGIDIENVTRDFSAVEKKVLSEYEIDYLDDKKRDLQLCLIWCAKEAIYKYACESGTDFAEQISIDEFTPHKKGKLTASYTNKEEETSEITLHYQIVEDHAMVWLCE